MENQNDDDQQINQNECNNQTFNIDDNKQTNQSEENHEVFNIDDNQQGTQNKHDQQPFIIDNLQQNQAINNQQSFKNDNQTAKQEKSTPETNNVDNGEQTNQNNEKPQTDQNNNDKELPKPVLEDPTKPPEQKKRPEKIVPILEFDADVEEIRVSPEYERFYNEEIEKNKQNDEEEDSFSAETEVLYFFQYITRKSKKLTDESLVDAEQIPSIFQFNRMKKTKSSEDDDDPFSSKAECAYSCLCCLCCGICFLCGELICGFDDIGDCLTCKCRSSRCSGCSSCDCDCDCKRSSSYSSSGCGCCSDDVVSSCGEFSHSIISTIICIAISIANIVLASIGSKEILDNTFLYITPTMTQVFNILHSISICFLPFLIPFSLKYEIGENELTKKLDDPVDNSDKYSLTVRQYSLTYQTAMNGFSTMQKFKFNLRIYLPIIINVLHLIVLLSRSLQLTSISSLMEVALIIYLIMEPPYYTSYRYNMPRLACYGHNKSIKLKIQDYSDYHKEHHKDQQHCSKTEKQEINSRNGSH